MADLKSMFGKPKESTNATQPSAAPQAESGLGKPTLRAFGGVKVQPAATPAPDGVSREADSAQSNAQTGSDGKPAVRAFAGFSKGLGTSASQVAGGAAGKAGSNESGGASAAVSSESERAGADPAEQSGSSLDSISDLASLDVSGTTELRSREAKAVASPFDDEIPAQAPTRELPEDITKEALQFVELIDGVYAAIHDVDLLGEVIKSIMIELKSNPQYMTHVVKEDVRTWVRLMRQHMGLAKIKKAEKKTGTTSRKSKAQDDDVMNALASLEGISFD